MFIALFREDKDFFDVTLACENSQIQAHKVVLSACSSFFRIVLKQNPHQHPLLYLKGVRYEDITSVLNFMYHGEVNVAQEELNTFLAVAEDLKVKGLTQNTQNVKQQEFQSPRPEKKASTPVFNTDYRPAKQQRVRPTIPSNTSERQYTEPEDIPLPQIKTEVPPPAEIEAEDTDTNQMVVTTEYQDDNSGYEEYEQEYETEQVEYETVAASQHNINNSPGKDYNIYSPYKCFDSRLVKCAKAISLSLL